MVRAFARLRVSAGEQTVGKQMEESRRQVPASPRSLVTHTVSGGTQAVAA